MTLGRQAGRLPRPCDHPPSRPPRAGYAMSGLLHLLIGWIALQVALGATAARTPTRAARWPPLRQRRGQGGAVGRRWSDSSAWPSGRSPMRSSATPAATDAWAGRAKAVGKAVVYLVLAWSAFQFARGKQQQRARASTSPPSCSGSPADARWSSPSALAVIGVGVYHVYKGGPSGSSQRPRRTTRARGPPAPGRSATSPRASPWPSSGSSSSPRACTSRPARAGGLDGALRTCASSPLARPCSRRWRRVRGVRRLQLLRASYAQGLSAPGRTARQRGLALTRRTVTPARGVPGGSPGRLRTRRSARAGTPRTRRRSRRPMGSSRRRWRAGCGCWRPSRKVSYCCSSARTTAAISSDPSISPAISARLSPAVAARSRRSRSSPVAAMHAFEPAARASANSLCAR